MRQQKSLSGVRSLLLLISLAFGMLLNPLHVSALSEQARILEASPEASPHRLTREALHTASLLPPGIIPLADEYLYVSSGEAARSLVQLEIPTPQEPTAVIGYSAEMDYIERLPFTYSSTEQLVRVVAENNSYVMPVREEAVSLFASSASVADAVSFRVTENHAGSVLLDVSGLVDTGKKDKYYYRVYQGDMLVTDDTFFTQGKIARTFLQSGVYRFEIFEKISFWPDSKLWEQELYVESSPPSPAMQQTLTNLAEEYAPIFTFSAQEKFKPVRLLDIFANASYQIAVSTKSGTYRMALPDAGKYIRYNGYSKGLLQGHWGLGTVSDSLETLPLSSYQPYIYYTYDELDNVYLINYHCFYNFDSKTEGISSIGAHNFDREQISITFDKRSLEPLDLYYPQHLLSSSMGMLDSSGDKINNILRNDTTYTNAWTGYVRLPVSEAKANGLVYEDTHTIVAVARGAHACYPLGAHYQVGIAKEDAGITASSPLPSQFLLPSALVNQAPAGSLFGPQNRYTLAHLDVDRLTSGGMAAKDINLLAFSGYWVDIVGTSNERFPPFIDIMKEPQQYVDQSMTGSAYQFTFQNIPPDMVQRASIVRQYITDQLR